MQGMTRTAPHNFNFNFNRENNIDQSWSSVCSDFKDMIQPEPPFLLLGQEEDKKRLCAQGG